MAFFDSHHSPESSQRQTHTTNQIVSSINDAATLRSAIGQNIREQNLRKFVGKWHKISGDEGHTCEITLRMRGSSQLLFLKLCIDQDGHFAELDAYNLTKIHVRHDFGFATFTLDYTGKYLTEENHSDGTNWVWKSGSFEERPFQFRPVVPRPRMLYHEDED